MRISCGTVADFLVNLSDAKSEAVYRKVIQVNTNRRQLTPGKKEECISWEWTIQATAVIETEDGGQFLLEVGEVCGVDHLDSNEMDGTQRMISLRDQIDDYCGERGLLVRPGIISE